MTAADKKHKETEAGAMGEAPVPAVGDLELLAEAEEAGVNNVEPHAGCSGIQIFSNIIALGLSPNTSTSFQPTRN